MKIKEKSVLRREIKQNIRAYHNVLHADFINSKSTEELLAWVHPADRPKFKWDLSKQKSN